MRLSDAEQSTLVCTIAAVDPDAKIWLHGSRTRDEARGGDIDLLVMSHHIGLKEKLDLLVQLHAVLGDRKIDLTITHDEERPFARLAIAQGVRL